MAASSLFDTTLRDVISGTIRPVYYLTGSENVLKDELVTRIVDQVIDPATRDFNLDTRSAEDLDGESLHSLIETPPMLAERRVVIIKYLEQWRKNAKVWKVLLRYVEDPSPTTILVLFHGKEPHPSLSATEYHVAVEPLPPKRVGRWVGDRARRAGLRLEPDAVTLLRQATGDDLAHIATELEKLSASFEGDVVTADTISGFVGMRRGETPADWVAAVLERDIGRAERMLDAVLSGSGVNGVRLVSQLGTAFVGTALAQALAHGGTPLRRLESSLHNELKRSRAHWIGDWSTAARQWTDAARRWTAAELQVALSAALEADRALKSTTATDERGILLGMLLATSVRDAAA